MAVRVCNGVAAHVTNNLGVALSTLAGCGAPIDGIHLLRLRRRAIVPRLPFTTEYRKSAQLLCRLRTLNGESPAATGGAAQKADTT